MVMTAPSTPYARSLASRVERFFFHAPLVVPTTTVMELRRQPEVAQAFEQFPHRDEAFVGIGAWQFGHSTLHDALYEEDRTEIRALGACGDFAGIVVQRNGEVIDRGVADRIIDVDADTLRAVPDVFGIAYSPVKAGAARAVIRSGLVNSLTVDSSLAEALLVEA
jgi:DNA-binding transcriptional regulator LsrR (DeoR family)